MRWIRDQAFPIRDASGVVHRIAGLAEDITEEKDRDDAASHCEERVGEALATAELGLWDWDRVSDRVYCSGRAMELLGHKNESRYLSLQELLSFVHEPDREEVAQRFSEAQEESSPCAIRHRIRRSDGSLQWLVWFGYALKKNGMASRLVGSIGLSG
jgi:PAS domain S-box-containing protein